MNGLSMVPVRPELNADEYFKLAITLTDQFNQAGFADFMHKHAGEKVSTESFMQLFDKAFGVNMHQRLVLQCSGGNLTDVRINLPGNTTQTTVNVSLKELVNHAAISFYNGCGQQFRVDD